MSKSQFQNGQLVLVARYLHRCSCGTVEEDYIVRVIDNVPDENGHITIEVSPNGCRISTPERRLRALNDRENTIAIERFPKSNKYALASIKPQ